MRRAAVLLACLLPGPAAALDVPGQAQLTAERIAERDRYAAPVGSFDGASIPVLELDGFVRRQAWRISGASLTVLQISEALAAQLAVQGFRKAFDCMADACGGFDFRFGIEILPAPNMYVNLRDYQFVTYVKGPEGAPDAATTFLVSKTRDTAFVQIVEVRADAPFEVAADDGERPAPAPVASVAAASLAASQAGLDDLVLKGSIVLDGLEFDSGATTLGAGPFPILSELAAYLAANPSLQIALVGHTDSVGSRDGNIRISRARAASVRDRLVERYGVNASRLRAEGMGYLAPVASNLTEAGRDRNRRVEAIVLTAN